MTKLYFVRHGKTDWNAAGRYQGSDGTSHLLPSSYVQIRQLGKYLQRQGQTFAHLYASPLRRARETAIALWPYLPGHPRLTLASGLVEFGLGRWEGASFTDVQAADPGQFAAFRHHPERFDAAVMGAETFAGVQARFTAVVERAVAANDPDANLLFVSHGAALTAGMGALLGTPLAHLRDDGGLRNAGLTVLERQADGRYVQLVRNFADYLSAPADATDVIYWQPSNRRRIRTPL
jgi:probable phosphoglycerate mutase